MATNFYVGLPEDGAPKKVTNQRAHAHTDIFQIGESTQQTQKKNLPSSKITNILVEDATDGKTETKEAKEQTEEKTENGNVPMQTAAPQRVRMPPGGFSSGLW